jgi:predicted  nucleic acid-binding Zn-ribbon protein
MTVNAKIAALLTLQADDDAIRAIEARANGIVPRVAALDTERQAADKAVAGARAALDREEERHGTLQQRADDFRRLTDRASAQSDRVDARHAAAAGAQWEIARKALADAEAELNGSAARLVALKGALTAAEQRVVQLAEQQRPQRDEIAAEVGELRRELGVLRARRAQSAQAVDATTLSRYDRVRTRRRAQAVYPVKPTPRGFSCGACDTAVATQRRTALAAGAIDVCEGCGVLLYARPAGDDASAGAETSAGVAG